MHLLFAAWDNISLNKIIGYPSVLQNHTQFIRIQVPRIRYMTPLVIRHYIPDCLQQREDNIFFAVLKEDRIEYFHKR